jgi:hypothetical protein
MARAEPGLLHRPFIASHLTGPDHWCASHGSQAGTDQLGAGILYYALAYANRARVCVCLGSGGGFVPRLMRQAQRDLGLEDSRTILVDADGKVEQDRKLWGRPTWTAEHSWFRATYPDVEIVLALTEDAHRDFFARAGLQIDYLHIDADHHYEGVRQDFDLYSPLVADEGVITLHDTVNHRPPCGVPRLVDELRRGGDWSLVNFPVRYGTAVVKRNPS